MLRDYIPALKFGARISPAELLGGVMLGMSTGNVYYVKGSSSTEYADFRKEYCITYKDGSESVQTAVDTAINQCTDSMGDVIAVVPGYTESVASSAAIDADVIGITILGLGNFETRPVISMGTATTADLEIAADDIRISNIHFKSAINDLGMFLDVNDSDFQVDNCKFSTANTLEAMAAIDLATTFDNFKILDCEFIQHTDPAGTNAAASTGAIFLVDSENILVRGCYFHDNWETAAIHNRTTACVNLVVQDCVFHNVLADAHIIELVAGAEGGAYNCHGYNFASSDVTEANMWGTLGTKFWIANDTSLGNDSGGGGQLAVAGTTACT